jgi:beta-ribofuranosylaminobenzene 5'-phosphate synthase
MKAMGVAKVSVEAPARLHMGFLDLHGGLGRRFGSIGLCLQEIATGLSAVPAPAVSAQGPSAVLARQDTEKLLAELGMHSGVKITVNKAIPEHSGLGSGTQMAMAVGAAVNRLFGLELPPHELSLLLHRGRRSGIGIGTFCVGGFIVDGGHSDDSGVPPILCQSPVPDTWRFLLVLDVTHHGLSGHDEIEAFQHLPPMDEAVADRICRRVLMQALPGIREGDCRAFGEAVTAIQSMNGAYFSASQGGGQFSSPAVAEVVHYLQAQGAMGVGQSSWGPTGFAIYANETEGHQALRQAREQLAGDSDLELKLCRARNYPATVTVQEAIMDNARRR